MAPLTASTKIQRRQGETFSLEVKQSVTIHRGALLALDATGWAAPATAAANLTAAGVADESVASVATNGDARVQTLQGCFLLKNDGGSPVTRAHIGGDCFIVDDQTVSSDATGTSRAGTVREVTDAGVWVEIS